MAIRATVEVGGMPVPDAYVRVTPVALSKTGVSFCREVFADAPEQGGAALCVDETVCPYDLNGPNPWVQAYEYLKAQPGYENAQDWQLETAELAVDTGTVEGPTAQGGGA